MAYTKTTWVNDSPPDINAENLNKMEQGIADAQFPEGGTTGQVLKKTENGIAWGDDQAGTDAVWGNITGSLENQTDLNNALSTLNDNINQKANASDVNIALATKADVSSVNSLAGSLAMVETSPATANHAVGDLIVFNNQLYKVTAAIASGEAIAVGTNVQADSVADELSSRTLKHKIVSGTGVISEAGGYVTIIVDFGLSSNEVYVGSFMEYITASQSMNSITVNVKLSSNSFRFVSTTPQVLQVFMTVLYY